MRYLELVLINYIGVYDGLGLKKIIIDFTKSKHNTTIIKGNNGSGKSTIWNAITPLPDSNDNFIPEVQAEKHVKILDNDIVYILKFIHGIDKNKKRMTTKAYISKIIQNEEIELNPNGNVSSYKDILYNEFKLDSSFISLSQLSSEEKGLASKTPSERKKLVTSIIDNISVYNDINKTLIKRSSIFKSMINNLVSKIDTIGDKEKIKLSLTSLEDRLNKILNKKDNMKELRSSYKSKIQLLDPDGRLQSTGNKIINDIITLKDQGESINKEIENYHTKFNISKSSYEDLLNTYNIIKDKIVKLNTEVSSKEDKINSLLNDRESESKEIQLKNQKLSSLLNDKNYKDIKDRLELSKVKLKDYESIISSIGITDIYKISKEEFILGLETIKDIKEMINIFKSNAYNYTLEKSIEYIKNNDNSYLYKSQDIDTQIQSNQDKLKDLSNELSHYNTLNDIASKLSLRPNKCNINECQFIKDALFASNQDPLSHIKEINQNIENINLKLQKLQDQRIEYDELISCINQLNILITTIRKNSIILDKLPINNTFKNKNLLLDRIMKHDEFKEIDILYRYIDYSNIIDEYKDEKSLYDELSNDYRLYESKSVIIDEINEDISFINTKLDSLLEEIESSNKELLEKKKSIENYNQILYNYDIIIKAYDRRKNILDQKNEVVSQYTTIKSNLRVIEECVNNINNLSNEIDELEKEIAPLMNDRDELKHGLLLLDQYKVELDEFNKKYTLVELIKKYSSPTKGIQTLYMKLYMNKTIELANQLLGLLFNGEFVIEEYIINENEFKIPCMGDGLRHDDISSMSSAQKSMISMILSFVLLNQSSTKYNVLKLDEIDAPLDNINRIYFLKALDELMKILHVEQCIMISHNEEIDLTNCDIIKLKTDAKITSGNIIFEY